MLLDEGQEEPIVVLNNIAHHNTLLDLDLINESFVGIRMYSVDVLESCEYVIELYTDVVGPKHQIDAAEDNLHQVMRQY